ncbi:MAG: hypothetical protein DDG60_12825 [Anaerolineae bacterium]|nr:MAG: hypothetical protein DDG60_12825 [Anaerolineae bacterium]
MYNFYFPPETEKRSAWRSAYEIKVAALEHEKRRYHLLQEYAALAKPQPTHRQGKQKNGWSALLELPLRFFANLLG